MNSYQSIFSDKELFLRVNSISDEKIRLFKESLKSFLSIDIKEYNEIKLQSSFEEKIFEPLGYKRISDGEYNSEREVKPSVDGTRVDIALGFIKTDIKDIRVIVELKEYGINLDRKQNRTNDNRTPVEQAFSYAPKFGLKCNWIIVSDYNEVRLYHKSDQTRYQRFFLSELLNNDKELRKFIYLFCKDNLICKTSKSEIDALFEISQNNEKEITDKFYDEYSDCRLNIFNNIVKNYDFSNIETKDLSKIKLLLLEKTQKILNRIVFICFCEDIGLVNPHTINNLIQYYKNNPFSNESLFDNIKNLFKSFYNGNPKANITAFKSDLFSDDEIIDKLNIDDDILENSLTSLSDYNFGSDLTVNILGHIFEQSIKDLEKIRADILQNEERVIDVKSANGVFYTPPYITQYIVKETVGKWLDNKKKELGFYKLPGLIDKKATKLKHINFWKEYRKAIQNIKVLDLACGSGAFLVAVYDYLKEEQLFVQNKLQDLGELLDLFDDNHILTENIYGVDLINESVEVSKLALWLKVAKKNESLTTLNNNIKYGNSVISDKSVDETAFDWHNEFKGILDSGGFDVIVGNPPYVSTDELPDIHKNYYTRFYSVAKNRLNLFTIFIEKSINLLKNNGEFGYIIPFTLLKNTQYKPTREFILENTSINKILDFSNTRIFDAAVDTIIILLSKSKNDSCSMEYIDKIININTENYKINYVKQSVFENNEDKAFINNNFDVNIETVNLNDIVDFRQGITTGNNPAFILTKEQIKHNNIEKDLCKQVLKGKNIDRYVIKYADEYVIYVDRNIDIEKYPNTLKWLSQFKEQQLEKREVKKGINSWHQLQWARDKGIFELHREHNKDLFEPKGKILIRQTGNFPVATFDDIGFYTIDSIHCGKIINNEYDIKFIIGLLNSRYYKELWYKLINEENKAFGQVKIEHLNKLPIPKLSLEEQKPIIDKVDLILSQNRKIQQINKAFLDFLSDDLGANGKELKNWYNKEWADFVKVLRKLGISLSGDIKEDWHERFINKKYAINELQKSISTLDSEIDSLVDNLFS